MMLFNKIGVALLAVGYIQVDSSEGAQIMNSEFAYLGYDELGRRGF